MTVEEIITECMLCKRVQDCITRAFEPKETAYGYQWHKDAMLISHGYCPECKDKVLASYGIIEEKPNNDILPMR